MSRFNQFASLMLVSLVAVTVHPFQALGQDRLPTHVLHDRVSSSVVRVVVNCGPECTRTGSGVVVGVEDGTATIVTNAHVIEGVVSAEAQFRDGRRAVVESFIDVYPAVDVALFQIDGSGLEPVQPADLGSLEIGHEVVLIGSPQGIIDIVSEAVFNGCMQVSNGNDPSFIAYVTTGGTALGGSSGGGVFDRSGRIVGVTVGTLTEDRTLADLDIDFAVPFSHVVQLLDMYQNNPDTLTIPQTRALIDLYRTVQAVASNLNSIEENVTASMQLMDFRLTNVRSVFSPEELNEGYADHESSLRSVQEDLPIIADAVDALERVLAVTVDTMSGVSNVVDPSCPD